MGSESIVNLLFSVAEPAQICFTLFATSALTEKANSGVFYRLLLNKHNTNINHASVAEAD